MPTAVKQIVATNVWPTGLGSQRNAVVHASRCTKLMRAQMSSCEQLQEAHRGAFGELASLFKGIPILFVKPFFRDAYLFVKALC